MCEPVSIASLVITAAGGIMQMQAQRAQGKAQANALRYESEVNKNNQVIQERLATDAIERGQEAEKQHRIKVGQLSSKQANAFALNGVEVNSGTSLDVLSDTASIGELEALTVRSNAEREAYGYRVNGMNYGASAQNNLMAANNALDSSRMSMYTTALSTAGSVSDKWYTYRQLGAFSNGGAYGGGYSDTSQGRINWYR